MLGVLSADPARAEEPESDAVGTTSESLSSCIAGGGEGDLLLLIDESGSLKATDPQNTRVTAATHFLERLTESVEESDATINLSVAAFGDVMRPVQDWGKLTSKTEPEFARSIATFVDRVNAHETDYWSALNGARESLTQAKSQRQDAQSCQAIVWFTDGEYTLIARDTAEAKQNFGTEKPYAAGIDLSGEGISEALRRGKTDLCRAGGIADQIRTSGLWLYGVGLSGADDDPSVLNPMQSIVTGSDDEDQTCGVVAPRAGTAFFHVTDIDDLLFAFDELASPDPLTSEGAICQSLDCAEKPHRVVLDASLSRVRVLAAPEIEGLTMLVETPDGIVTEIAPGPPGEETRVKLAGAEIVAEAKTAKTVDVRIDALPGDRAGNSWTGLWQFGFADLSGSSQGKTSKANIHVRSSLLPSFLDAAGTELRLGEIVPIELGAVDDAAAGGFTTEAGKPTSFDLSKLLGSFEFTAVMQDSSGTRHDVIRTSDASELAKPISLDLQDVALGSGILNLSLSITTADAKDAAGTQVPGTQLTASTATVPINVLPPLDYPAVSGKLDFGVVVGDPVAKAELQLTGEGCVWVDGDAAAVVTAAPEESGTVKLAAGGADSAATCFEVDGPTTLPVEFRAEKAGNGAVNGRLPLHLESASGEGETLVVEVPFTSSLQKPVNSMNFLAALLAALLLGPGLPLALLYGAKWLVSRIPRTPFVAARVPVVVTPGSVRRGGEAFSLELSDLRDLVELDTPRRFTANGLSFAVRMGRSPVGAGRVEVLNETPASAAPATADHAGTDSSGLRAVLPLAVQNSWIALRDSAGVEEVLVFVPAGADSGVLRNLEQRINGEAPRVFERLRANAGPGADSPEFSTGGGFPAPPAAPPTSPTWPPPPAFPPPPQPPQS